MEEEYFVTGFCREINDQRMVCFETEMQNGKTNIIDINCNYGNCPQQGACEVAKKISEIMSKIHS